MTEALSERYLAVRADDHVVLGVQWWGAEPIVGEGPARLHVGPGGGGLLITFPPQHLGEGAFDPGVPLLITTGILAGLSQVAVALEADVVVGLDLAGILAALRTGHVHGRRFADGTDATLIELPYGLRSAPISESGRAVTTVHPTEPVESTSSKAVGLWRTRLLGSGAGVGPGADASGDLRLAAPEPVPHSPEPGSLPIAAGRRQLVIDAIRARPAAVGRLELSALGGSLSASTSTETVDWSQDVALGRDQRVRLVEHGVLHPFGHRALYIEATERQFDASDQTAGLRTHRSLIVTEPTKSVVIDDPSLNRRFPFDDVEITTCVFSNLGKPVERHFIRPAPDIADKVNERDAKQASRDALRLGIDPFLTRDRTVDELDTQEALEYIGFRARIAELDVQLAEARANDAALADLVDRLNGAQAALDRLLKQVGQTPENEPTGLEQEIAEASATVTELAGEVREFPAAAPGAIDAMQHERDDDDRELRRLQPIVDQQGQRDLSVEELAAGDPNAPGVLDAQAILALDAEIAVLRGVIEANATRAVDRDWIVGPTVLPAPPLPPGAPAESLAPLLFPLRCSTRTSAQPDVYLDVPLVFIVDFRLDADDAFPAFNSLTDGEGIQTLQAILDQFSASRGTGGLTTLVGNGETLHADAALPAIGIAVGLAGTQIDVIHGAVQAAGDSLEVHGLTLTGLPHAGGFVPAITEYRAVLPAVRGLLGAGQDTIIPVGYRSAFIEQGDAEDLALELLGGTRLGIDFRAQADRSGALLAPVIEATGISRLNGPVSVEGALSAAAGHLDPFKVLGDGASLLGFDLRDLIGELPAPPRIVNQLLDGRPVIQVKWGGVQPPDKPIVLTTVGPFEAVGRSGAKATVTLTARVAPEGVTSECIVRDFALCFPSPGDPLIRLSFDSVVFTQAFGHEPDLSVHGVTAAFLGDLALLEDLQQAVDLGGNVPKVKVSSGSIGVGYAFEVPNADCGEFSLRNIAVRAGLDVPFQPTDAEPIVLSLGFASRAKPFNLSVMALGGGGYIDVEITSGGLRRMELSLEFGATLALKFGIVGAEVHALAGARAEIGPGTHVAITGYVRIGGSVELLGLVTVTIELVVSLRYDKASAALLGRATIVVEIDLTLYSDSIELDSGEWRLVGGGVPLLDAVPAGDAGREGDRSVVRNAVQSLRERGDRVGGLEAWRRYRRAFAPEVIP